ncbi:MAG: choice-of-anchor L domain-containing protein, partial [Bacteroidota bacterium]|nr:choice-of-anchor L domain-containing protein [Bacteroidota bacterium]
MQKICHILLVLLLFCQIAYTQITIDKTAPYDSPTWLVDNILLGGGVVASNHSYQGDSMQIGFFNAINTNLGLDSGVVMATGDIDMLDPFFVGVPGVNPPNTVTDPDLLAVANSVPPLIGQTFVVSSINDVAILEFDFTPTSDTVKFRYVFGSQEYHTFENTAYNDVFGFFLSGPGITGPYSSPPIHPNGSINLAIVPNSNPPLPITISSVHNGQNGIITPLNAQYFVDNSSLSFINDADGYTTVLMAISEVQCGQTYHIRLAIADGSDQGLSSYVWLEAGSFSSPTLDIVDNMSIDSTFMEIDCDSSIILLADAGQGATYQWYDITNTVIGTDSFITVGPGQYWVAATSVGCAIYSDTLTVFSKPPPTFELGLDYNIPCNTTTFIDPIVTGGTGVYNYIWNNGSFDSSLLVGQGYY